MITKQQALDKFIDRIMKNEPLAIGDQANCMYNKSVNGGCAIGCLIPSNIPYNPKWEGMAVESLFDNYKEIRDEFEDPNSSFWIYLQQCHDGLTELFSFNLQEAIYYM